MLIILCCILYVVLHISADELPSLGDNVFNVIIARNSLHFISNIPKLYDDMKFLLRSHGIFVKISSPLFDLGGLGIRSSVKSFRVQVVYDISVFTEDSQKSFLINSELKNFTENKFEQELKEYWDTKVKENFVKFCDPFRTGKIVFLSTLKQYEFQTSEIIHLMELKEHIIDITIVANFIKNHGIEKFEEIYQNFLHNIYFLLDIEPCDMYFDDIRIIRKDTFYVEVQSNKD